MTSADRAVPFYCPYCGEEDLRPHEGGAGEERAGEERAGEERAGGQQKATSHGGWECRGCARVFSVKFVGLVPREVAR